MKRKHLLIINLLLSQTITVWAMDEDNMQKTALVQRQKPAIKQRLDLVGSTPTASLISRTINLAQQDQDDQERVIRNALLEVKDQNSWLESYANKLMRNNFGNVFKIKITPSILELYQVNDNSMDGSSHLYHAGNSSFNSSDNYTGSSTNRSGGGGGISFLGIISASGKGENFSISAPHASSSQSRTSNNVHDEKQSLSLIANRKLHLKIVAGEVIYESTADQSSKNSNYSRHNNEHSSLVKSNEYNNATKNNNRPSEEPKQITYERPVSPKPHIEKREEKLKNNCEVKRPTDRKINSGHAQFGQPQNKKMNSHKNGEKK